MANFARRNNIQRNLGCDILHLLKGNSNVIIGHGVSVVTVVRTRTVLSVTISRSVEGVCQKDTSVIYFYIRVLDCALTGHLHPWCVCFTSCT